MNFSQRQADPRRHLVGITVVILLHIIIVYALVTGLRENTVPALLESPPASVTPYSMPSCPWAR